MKTVHGLVALAVMGAVGLGSGSTYAGRLCGKGGLFGGSPGELCDRIIDKPLTPILRRSVENGEAALGCKLGGPVGCVLGHGVGQGINGAFAGGGGHGAPVGPAPLPYATPQYPQPPMYPAAAPANLGNVCITPVGRFVGDYNPLGMPCKKMTQWGMFNGYVGL